eukprot:Ihof_evm2s220 gene=Ihof_evmTU2s220
MGLDNIVIDQEEYVALLSKMIGESRYVQNSPPQFVPEETRVARHVMKLLEEYTQPKGPLIVELIEYHKNRGNLIIQYPATIGDAATAPTVGFVGSHMDVVVANEESWAFPAFELTREGDELRGRGTTDCLGHVALLTLLMKELAKGKVAMRTTVACVFIASEENNSIPGVGVDALMKEGRLEFLKKGPVYWVDSADTQPCQGTASALTFHLTAEGKTFHAGLPHKGINALELAMEASGELQKRFFQEFPKHPMEFHYPFQTSSTMKPTQINSAQGTINTMPGTCTISGDIRMTPFFDVHEVMSTMQKWVSELNETKMSGVPTRGPYSRYHLPEDNVTGKLTLQFGAADTRGIACNLESPGYKALADATKEVVGTLDPYAIGGSLPLVREMQEAGMDIQICGYGVMA